MTEPPGARLRVGLIGLTVAEYFRDAENKDVLLFIDNIFRFTQAGSEVSALLGRMPSAVGYQPTLLTEMGELQERITSTKKGSITSVQAIYVPADDYTDPAPATTFAHLDATTNLSRAIVGARHLPGGRSAGVDVAHPRPAHHRRRALQRRARGEADPAALQGPAGHHRDSRHRRAVGRRQADRRPRARKIQRFLSQPFFVAEQFTGLEGKYVPIADTIRGFKEIVDGKHDDLPEQAFYMVGTIEEAVEKAEKMKALDRMALPTNLELADRHARPARSSSEQVDEVEIPGAEGYFGVLPGHTPLLASLAGRRAVVPARARRRPICRSRSASPKCCPTA